MRRRAALGCDHNEAAVVCRVGEGSNPRLTRLGAGRGQEQEGGAGEHAADLSPIGAELLDQLSIEFVVVRGLFVLLGLSHCFSLFFSSGRRQPQFVPHLFRSPAFLPSCRSAGCPPASGPRPPSATASLPTTIDRGSDVEYPPRVSRLPFAPDRYPIP